MMWAYNQDEQPPAPFIEIQLRHPEEPTRVARLSAKIDTGADISALPAATIAQLGLPVTSKLMVAGYDGVPTAITTYGVILVVEQIRFKIQEIIAISEPHALLGRDVLNYFYLQLNGPDLNLMISAKPF
ncbi:MAG: hypothetical protein U0175_09290 [Caldilineaceae bacterium]